eukprot:gnl/Spiro4/16129_TR8670_c0_g1_i1.p1 gnl/Spiro4/16129_TR8670_c0_g1~~gnl/Spiro4/16129_TR8670_c0_g1_i1.p1  ORF type:complete len:220 (+),score=18.18 gnl/Spiro4/16129_TR8670_c0_g1_i1:182-841(+)
MSSPEDDYEFLFKLILAGDTCVGKSQLFSRFTRDEFANWSRPTIGVDLAFATRSMSEADGATIKAQIWDTAGQERFRAVTNTYYRGALGALVVYDVTNLTSFQHLDRWITELREHAEHGVVLIVVANKIDLYDSRLVSTEMGREYADKQGVMYIETSALEGTGVEQAFRRVLAAIYQNVKAAHLASLSPPVERELPVVSPRGKSLQLEIVPLPRKRCPC